MIDIEAQKERFRESDRRRMMATSAVEVAKDIALMRAKGITGTALQIAIQCHRALLEKQSVYQGSRIPD